MAPLLALDQHVERAQRHQTVGDALCAAGDEWAAVCYFYSAYHVAQYSLRTDPVFEDRAALHRINAQLEPRHRGTSRHRGRRPRAGDQREFGVNELVSLLYPEITTAYEVLHLASIEVRYDSGIIDRPLRTLQDRLAQIWSAHDRGALRRG